MVDDNKVKETLNWYRDNIAEYQEIPTRDFLFNPIMEALGNDVDEILSYLDSMDVEDLDWISGIFEDIYGKWTTDDVWDALGELEEKIKNNIE